MRVVPVLYPCDLGSTDRGEPKSWGERGAPDLMLDLLEGEGIRLTRPKHVPLEAPDDPDPEDAPLKLDAYVAKAIQSLAEVVAAVNADGHFPVILGGDHTALCGHALGHAAQHTQGIGVAILADAQLDLATPAPPVYDDKKRLRTERDVTCDGDADRMVLAATLRMLSGSPGSTSSRPYQADGPENRVRAGV